MKYSILTFLLSIIFFLPSCDIINPEEEVPSYIEILPFEYTGTDGSNSANLSDAWLYVGGEFIGAFDLPKTIPVLYSGDQEILIDPGVEENGISALPIIYPFYNRYTESVNLNPGEITTIQPRTSYDSERSDIIFSEYFDGGSNKFNTDVSNSDEDVKEGERSGLITLDDENKPAVTAKTVVISVFPNEGFTGYLELDYKTDVPVFIGMEGYTNLGDLVFNELSYGLNANDEWNKVYFSLTEQFNLLNQNNADFYLLKIAAQIPVENGEFTLENAEIRLDNLKLVVF